MTVREAVSVLKGAEEISLEWNSQCVRLMPDDSVMMAAYGDFKVDFIMGFKEDPVTRVSKVYEIGIATMPVREVAK